MGQSTDGQICYGVMLEDGVELPWDAAPFDGDEEEWWRAINGYEPIYQPYTPEGEYAPGWSRDDIRFGEYFHHRRKWLEEHPLPIELVNYCSGDYPMWIIATPGTVIEASRGYPREISAADLATPEGAGDLLCEFCQKYDIDIGDEQPKWWLSGYWG